MTVLLARGRYRARLAETAADLRAAQALRYLVFVERGGARPRTGGLDADTFDDRCQHVLIEKVAEGALVGCFRLLATTGAGISDSYAAQHYDLTRLTGFAGPMSEIGRFCIRPDVHDPDVLRVAWGAITRHVDANAVGFLFGCASFAGIDPSRYGAAFDLLAARHSAPATLAPGIGAMRVCPFGTARAPSGTARAVDAAAAMAQMPPLLRTYLAMGGWVSDHAVIDPEMNTLHVFTGVEIAAIPPARARSLRMIAGGDAVAAQ